METQGVLPVDNDELYLNRLSLVIAAWLTVTLLVAGVLAFITL